MKIKIVCERTGLTDRTIRYYIEEGIISPAFTENYLGRKSFDFTEEDVLQLQDIAVLRSFDFSIEEIRQILNDPSSSLSIIRCVKERVQAELFTSQKKMSALSSLSEHTVYTVGEIARELSKPLVIVHAENVAQPKLGTRIKALVKGVCFFLSVWLPFLLSVGILPVLYLWYDNPIVNGVWVLLTILCLVPSCVCMFVQKTKVWQKRLYKTVLFGFCVLCIPMSAFGVSQSVRECNHTFQNLSVELEASCDRAGSVIQRCNICRDVRKVSLEKIAHSAVKDDLVLPTCGTVGLTEGSHCSSCGMTIVEQESIPMTNEHTYIPYTTEPTCGQDGYVLMICQCGKAYLGETLAANEKHLFLKNGEKGLRCSLCGLEVCEHNYNTSDGWVGYYITGTAEKEQERTLVIYGKGDASVLVNGEYPLYRESQFIQEVTTVIICDEITSLSKSAFEWDGTFFMNPFRSIRYFLVKGELLTLDTNSKQMSGVSCEVTYSHGDE